MVIEGFFWFLFFLLAHTWGGYPILLKVMIVTKRRRTELSTGKDSPIISLVIAAYNAEDAILGKLRNTMELDYPLDKLEIVVISDGSTDKTAELARTIEYTKLSVYELERNKGKSAAQNYGVEKARGNIIVFTDVDSEFDKGFLKNLVPYFASPNVACVGGNALHREQGSDISVSQGLYWRLEQFIRMAESDLGVLVSLPGWGFAARKSDFIPFDEDTGDDMILPMDMALHGKKSVIAPNAIVTDTMPSTIKGELKARSRITLRNLTGLMRRKALLNPFRFPGLAFSLISHKLLRWLSPVFMILVFLFSALSYVDTGILLYLVLFVIQLVVYILGLVGIYYIARGHRIPVLGIISSFILANAGFLLGLFKFFSGKRVRSYGNID